MTTFNVTIALPESVTFVRAGLTVTYSMIDFTSEIIAELCEHGLVQKIGDAAAGKPADEAKPAMDKVWDALRRGDWGVRRAPKADDDGIIKDDHFWPRAAAAMQMPRKPKEKVGDWRERLLAAFNESTTAKRERIVAAADAARQREADEIAALADE